MKKKITLSIIIFVIGVIIGTAIGYHGAIIDAKLIHADKDGYELDFHGQVHTYDYE